MNNELTSFRALGFLAVFLFHIHVLSAGYLGVQAFFVLSGFLLIPIMIDMKANLSVRNFFVNFYGRRALRIFPIYYLYLIVVAVISILITSQKGYGGIIRIDRFLEQLPWSLTFTYNFFHATELFRHTHLVTHFWALAVEWQFYLLWPILLFFTPSRHLKKILLVIFLFGPVMRFFISIIIMKNMWPILLDFVDLVVYVLPFSHIDAFAAGGYFALYQKSRSKSSTWLVIIFSIALGFIADYIFSPGNNEDILSLGYAPFMRDSYKYVWGYSVINLVLAYMLIQIRDQKFIPILFQNRVLIYLGKISYSLYIFHFPVIWLIFYHLMPGHSLLIKGLLSFILSVLISAISDAFIEEKFIRLKDKYFSKKSAENNLNRTETALSSTSTG